LLRPELLTQSYRRLRETTTSDVKEPLPPEAFGLDLMFLRDLDADGIPDMVAPLARAPAVDLKRY
jgi:hypothetical protein